MYSLWQLPFFFLLYGFIFLLHFSDAYDLYANHFLANNNSCSCSDRAAPSFVPWSGSLTSRAAAHWCNAAFFDGHVSAPFRFKSRGKLGSRFHGEPRLPSSIRYVSIQRNSVVVRAVVSWLQICVRHYIQSEYRCLCSPSRVKLSWPASLFSQTLCQRIVATFFKNYYYFYSDSLAPPLAKKKKKTSYSIMPYMCLTNLWFLCLCWSHVGPSACRDSFLPLLQLMRAIRWTGFSR